MATRTIHRVDTPSLALAYEEHGAGDEVVILLHGFPYSVRAYDAVAPALAAQGMRCWCPTCAATAPAGFSPATPALRPAGGPGT